MPQYIISSGSTTIASQTDAMLIQVNSALTGTITCQANSVTFAVITNPAVGSEFRYGGLHGQGPITVNPSATCDISVTLLHRIS